MPDIIRQILGWIILFVIIWDTIVSIKLLQLFYQIKQDLILHKELHDREKIQKMTMQDVTAIAQTIGAIISACLTTYTFIKAIRNEKLHAKYIAPTNTRNHSLWRRHSINDNTSGSGKNKSG